jgi:signal transduction histidine kinase
LLFTAFLAAQEGEADLSPIDRALACGNGITSENTVSLDDRIAIYEAALLACEVEKVKDKKLILHFTLETGLLHLLKGNYEQAIDYLQKVLPLAEELHKSYEYTRSINNIANAYSLQGEYARALEYYLKGLQLCRKRSSEDEKENYSRITGNLAETYFMMGNYRQAFYYAQHFFETCKPVNSYLHAQAHHILGAVYLYRGELEPAEEEAWKAFNNGNSVIADCFAMETLARIYIERQDYGTALEYAFESLCYAEALGDPNSFIRAYNAISSVYLGQQLYARAESEALKALEKNPQAFDLEPRLAYTVALSNIRLGNKAKAETYLRKYDEVTKRNTEKSFQELLAGMEVQYKIKEKEIHIRSLESEKRLYGWIGVTIGFILLLACGLLFFLQRIARQKQKIARQHIRQIKQEREMEIAQSIIDAEMKLQKEIAGDLHDSLGALLTLVKINLSDGNNLPRAGEMIDRSVSELRRITRRLMPPSLRYGLRAALEDFCLQFPNVDFFFCGEEESLKETLEIFLCRSAYELVNNASKYSGAGMIRVKLLQEHDKAVLTVEDDGCGFDPDASPKGIGIRNIKESVNIHNGVFTIYSVPGKGTKANIFIRL